MSYLDLNEKDLETLEGQNIPDTIAGDFYCSNNRLTSLQFGPKEVAGNYRSGYNRLTSLEFCATKIGISLFTSGNSIENLKGIHKQFKEGYIGKHFGLEDNPLKSHVLGIILIPKLQVITMNKMKVQSIINNQLQSGRDVLECQEELIQNGFKEFAQL